MQIRLLGTAAGGGLPQWNCNCPNCREARLGSGFVRPRTQSSVAVSADGQRWFLLNASPDIARQIAAFPPLQPAAFHPRGTPIEAVLLTNADLDHTLGLLLLREGPALHIYASEATDAALTLGAPLLPILDSFCSTKLFHASFQETPLHHRDGTPSALSYQAFAVPAKTPRFAKTRDPQNVGPASRRPAPGAIAYKIHDSQTGGSLIYAPEVLEINDAMLSLAKDCNLLLFDGTFWSDDEMTTLGINRVTARQMGHVPIHGKGGSLAAFAGVTGPKKVYVHINNTNPILREDSSERREATAAGWQIGEDGMEFII